MRTDFDPSRFADLVERERIRLAMLPAPVTGKYKLTLATEAAAGDQDVVDDIGHRQVEVLLCLHPRGRQMKHLVREIDFLPAKSGDLVFAHACEETDDDQITLDIRREHFRG